MMVLDDLLAVVQEQYRLVEGAGDDPDHLFPRTWDLIRRLRQDPRTNAVLGELLAESVVAEKSLRAAYVEHLEQAREILLKLRKDFPELFEGPEPTEELARLLDYRKIDRLLGQTGDPQAYLLPSELTAYHAVRIVQTYLERAGVVGTGSPRSDELEALRRSDQLARRLWRVETLEPAFAYADLSRRLAPLDPQWARAAPVGPIPRELEELVPPAQAVAAWADGTLPDNRSAREELRETVVRVKNAASLVHAEVRARLGSARSKLTLFERFKTRCEMYDRERLMELADKAKPLAHAKATKKKPRRAPGPENRLSEELALFLFDQGLDPLIRPPIGNVEPDILDPKERVYVEAKQYDSDARDEIRTAARQAWEMMARLTSSGYRVREAFLPVFRRGGPVYQLPLDPIRNVQGFVLFPMLIDLAPTEEGARVSRRKPISIPASELMPEE
jgi:hypothetical protein